MTADPVLRVRVTDDLHSLFQAVTAETVSYDFLAQLDNGVNDMGVTDRIVALSEYTTNSCGQKALTCDAADNRRE